MDRHRARYLPGCTLPVDQLLRPGRVRVATQGATTDVLGAVPRQLQCMSRFMLQHRHTARRVRRGFRGIQGTREPLRHRTTLASCRSGGHAIWWTVEAETEAEALQLLPYYVAERTTVSRVSEVRSHDP